MGETTALPRDVACPRCAAGRDWACVSRSHKGTYRARTHIARWKAVGIESPTFDDRHRDYLDGLRRDAAINERAHKLSRAST